MANDVPLRPAEADLASAGNTVQFLPILNPIPGYAPPAARAPLTPEQLHSLRSLIDHFNSTSFSPPLTLAELKSSRKSSGVFNSLFSSSEQPAIVGLPLSDAEKCWWSREAFLRSLRATKWKTQEAIERSEDILVWRREFAGGVDTITADRIEKEALTGKELILGFDYQGRPVLYMHPNRQNTATSFSQLEFVVWCLERAIDLSTADDTICLCIDLITKRDDGQFAIPAVSQGIKVLEILQTYYCERLGRAICNVPSIFWIFFRLVRGFIDPITKEKIQFNVDASQFIPREQLQSVAFGGEYNFSFQHDKYFPALVALCTERRAANLERWKENGGKCGLEDKIIKGIAERYCSELAIAQS